MNNTTPAGATGGQRQKGAAKTARLPIRIVPAERLAKPAWIRVRAASPSTRFREIETILRANGLVTVCEEASCPNIGECFGKGGATFMIMGSLCTRRCPFCDVAHGRPDALDAAEPGRLAATIAALGLRHVVITSVNRDDLRDGGAAHFAECIGQVRALAPHTRVEILVPDFRGRLGHALEALAAAPPDVLNHNIETVPRLYPAVRPGASYGHSLALLRRCKTRYPGLRTKSGIMLGLGETDDEVLAVLRDLRDNHVDMLTIGQYLAPSGSHLPVQRYVEPATFDAFRAQALAMGFLHVAAGPLVRSSYHADQQALAAGLDDAGAGEIRRRQRTPAGAPGTLMPMAAGDGPQPFRALPDPGVWEEGDEIY